MGVTKRVVIAWMAVFAIDAAATDIDAIPWLRQPGRDVFKDKYLPAPAHKAFAIAKTGAYAWSTNRDSAGRAAKIALYNCLKFASDRCFVYSLDDQDVFASYDEHARASELALGRLRAPAKASYDDEDKDVHVAVLEGLKSGQLHEPTPTSSPHAKTVTTGRLIEMLSAPQRPVVIDVLDATGEFAKEGIPSAIWVSGAGDSSESASERIDDFFARIMTRLVPAKDSPIVVYCLSWECWLSYNAIYRLSKLGYTNLHWYRGGMDAWRAAQLPTVREPLAAEVD